MLPTFLIIGTHKGGTTSLHEYLTSHPDVGAPTIKEIHYFTRNAGRPLSWYASHFPLRSAGWQHTCESTPYYLFHPCCPARVHRVLPDAKLIVLLRDPVARAYSHYQNDCEGGHEHLSFADALAHEADRLAGEADRLIADPRYYSYTHQHYSYIARGMYASQLVAWYEYFDRDQILLVTSDELFAETEPTLHTIQRWLDLPPHTPDSLSPRNARSYLPLDPDMQARLRAAFAADSRRLTELTGRVFPWQTAELISKSQDSARPMA